MADRKLAYVVTVDSLHPIEGADFIEIAMVGGWQVVVQKGLYKKGDAAMYFEVDSLLPTEHNAFKSLTNLSSKLLFEINGKGYARIKTAKIRKQLSQGFLVPLSEVITNDDFPILGDDYTNKLGVLKYESGEERSMNNATANRESIRSFPSFIPKTDQNRVQNIVPRYLAAVDSKEVFEKSFKLDGSSMTVWYKDGDIGVASRNVAFRVEPVKRSFYETLKDFLDQWWNQGKSIARSKWRPTLPETVNAFTQAAKDSGVVSVLKKEKLNLAIQGELVGPNIQKNFEGVDSNQYFIYDIYDIDKQKYMLPEERHDFVIKNNLSHVPLHGFVELLPSVAEAIDDANGPSGLKGKYREGFVYKSISRDFSFKVISNNYLLKEQ